MTTKELEKFRAETAARFMAAIEARVGIGDDVKAARASIASAEALIAALKIVPTGTNAT